MADVSRHLQHFVCSECGEDYATHDPGYGRALCEECAALPDLEQWEINTIKARREAMLAAIRQGEEPKRRVG